jgi:hypothetical protein
MSLLQELLAYISLYFVVNLIYRELLVRKSECSEDDVLSYCTEVSLGSCVFKFN